MIPVSCRCGFRSEVKDERAGKSVKCPICDEPIEVSGGPGEWQEEVPLRSASRGSTFLAIALSLFVFAAFAVSLFVYFKRASAKPQSVPVAVAPEREETEQEKLARIKAMSPREVLQAYFAASSVAEKGLYVRNGRATLPMIHQNVRREPFMETCDIIGESQIKPSPFFPFEVDGFQVKRADGNLQIYSVVKTDSGYKVDWEALGLAGTPLKLFTVERFEEPIKFRVMAELSDYYAYDFETFRRWCYSFKLTDRSGAVVFGYLDREAPHAAAYVGAMSRVDGARVIVELWQRAYRGSRLGSDRLDHVFITRFVSPTWVDPED